jgi:hypothetical protein
MSASVSVVDALKLRAQLTAFRKHRDEEVIETLEQAEAEHTSIPNIITLKIGGFTAKVSAYDLLVSTSAGRFHASALASSSVIEIPEDVPAAPHGELSEAILSSHSEVALTTVVQLLKNQRHDVPAASVTHVVWICNYIGAEDILSGFSLSSRK